MLWLVNHRKMLVGPTSSYRIVGHPADTAPALRSDSVSAVQLQRATISALPFEWHPSDTRASLTVCEASANAAALVKSTFHAPDAVLDDMTQLIHLCALIAQQEGGASGEAKIHSRLLVTSGAESAKCPRLHYDAVRWPWCRERRTNTGDVLVMKGSGWRRGLSRDRNLQRAFPVMHRSPSVSSDGKLPLNRVLFTVDFGGD